MESQEKRFSHKRMLKWALESFNRAVRNIVKLLVALADILKLLWVISANNITWYPGYAYADTDSNYYIGINQCLVLVGPYSKRWIRFFPFVNYSNIFTYVYEKCLIEIAELSIISSSFDLISLIVSWERFKLLTSVCLSYSCCNIIWINL